MCEGGSLQAVKAELEQAPNHLDHGDSFGVTPLQKAAFRGHAAIVEFLIVRVCRTDCIDLDGDTQLSNAVKKNHRDIVRILPEKGKVDP